MAVVYTFDLISGAGADFSETGTELVRKVHVAGLSGDGWARIQQAVLGLYTQHGIAIGSGYPSFPSCYLRQITPEVLDSENLTLSLVYKTWDLSRSEYSIGGSVGSEQSNQDKDGNDVLLAYLYPVDYPEQERQGVFEETSAIYNKRIPNTRITMQRDEVFDLDNVTPLTGVILANRHKSFVGKTNTSGWYLFSSDAAGTWFCTNITGSSKNGGITWQVTYTFEYDSRGWSPRMVFNDPNTGKPPSDLGEGTGKIWVDAYHQVNFNLLGVF